MLVVYINHRRQQLVHPSREQRLVNYKPHGFWWKKKRNKCNFYNTLGDVLYLFHLLCNNTYKSIHTHTHILHIILRRRLGWFRFDSRRKMREKQRFVKDIFGRKSKEQSTIGRNKIIVRYSWACNVPTLCYMYKYISLL